MLYDNFCGNVQMLLDKRGISRAELARRMDVSASFVTQILNGHREPGLGVIEDVAAALEVPATDLFKKIRQPA